MGRGGFWAGDAIAQAIDNAALADRYARSVDAAIERRKEADARYLELALTNSANLAEKHALRTALAKLDPRHPLLTNAHLRERIHHAAEQVYAISSSSWTDIANVGRDFKY